jgi:hypothetical protein
MTGSTVVDIHAHFVPEGYLRLIETEGPKHGLELRQSPDGPMIMIGQVPIGPITPGYYDLDRRLGSDYCFDMGYADPVAALAAVESPAPAGRARILGLNAVRLLGLE